ncbi:MAG: glycoside hydrolase family 5 protein [Acidobacteriota bacterium]
MSALGVDGRFIVERATGMPVQLRGVNLSGMEYESARHAGVTEGELELMLEGWGANVVRVPFVQSRALGERGYREELRDLVEWIGVRGGYTILDLQWLDRERVWGPGKNRVPPEPDEGSEQVWEVLAREFRGTPWVIFDLFNEPHDIGVERWCGWAERLGRAVRAVDEERVLMVGGLDWAYDLRGVRVGLRDVVYSTHVYPGKGWEWEAAFGRRAGSEAVFAGEFGGVAKDLAWGRELLDYFDELGMGWTAWSWRDHPHLQRGGEATEFGELVRERLGGKKNGAGS